MRWKASAVTLAALLLLGPPPTRPADPGPAARDERRLQKEGIKTDGSSLLGFFRSRSVQSTPEEVAKFIQALGSRAFSRRQRATANLVKLGAWAVPQLQKATSSTDLEVSRRAADCLRQIQARSEPGLVEAAARLLTLRKPEGAAQALLDFLPGALEQSSVQVFHDCLAKLAVRDGKPEPAILKALSDPVGVRRTAAAVAVCKANLKDKLALVGPLLKDTDPLVRLHTGLHLARAGEKEAVPVLIALFDDLPRNHLWQAEDLLYTLAGGKAPPAVFDDTAKARKGFRAAWEAWWKERGQKLDLVALLKKTYRDWTLVVMLDENEVFELDSKDKERFKISKVEFPLDAQTLPGDRVLLAEHGGGRVTERLYDGTVLWECKVAEPLVAKRLPGGNTFVACKDRLIEVDRAGKEVFTWVPPGQQQIMRANKLDDGTYAVILNETQEYFRFDAEGKVVDESRLNVNVHTSGGRVDVQENGNVLIPVMYQNKVYEFAPGGKVVREFSVRQPIVAARLPNGHTIITSMTDNKAVEFDLAGKQVWEYAGKTRVTRTYRR